jgi:hypothetical protein
MKSRSWNIGLFRSLTEVIETKVTRNSAFNGKYIVCRHGDIITRQKNDGDQFDPHKAEKNVVCEGVRDGTENCCKLQFLMSTMLMSTMLKFRQRSEIITASFGKGTNLASMLRPIRRE